MIIDILKILIPYFSGIIVSFLMFHPVKEWKDGYKVARERYNNWDLGFEEGYKCARKHFQNYDEVSVLDSRRDGIQHLGIMNRRASDET